MNLGDMLIAGVDEAGRGPVIGPMVMACFAIRENKLAKLELLDVKDSKLVPKNKREGLYKELLKLADKHSIISVYPKEIDDALGDQSLNLNILEANTTTKLLNDVEADKAFVDCPARDINNYIGHIKSGLKKQVELIVEHKADVNYKVASAASILAKVVRDRHVEEIKEKFGIECGSGYLTDPATMNFLEKEWNNEKYKGIFRESWVTIKNFKKEKAQARLGDF